jgi:hypothetical protein
MNHLFDSIQEEAYWLEILEIRFPLDSLPLVESYMTSIRAELAKDGSYDAVSIYRQAEVSTDWCIHIHHTKKRVPAGGSEIGRQLLSSLGEVGTVYHAVWRHLPGSMVVHAGDA